jgi:hypothetical protein
MVVPMTEPAPYRPVLRPYEHRYRYVYRRHVFDKLRSLDLGLAEFQQLLGDGEVIAEAPEGPLQTKELVLLVTWRVPLHVAIAVDVARGEERLVTVYEPDLDLWTSDLRRRR